MSTTGAFAVGEKVLVANADKSYDGKVLRAKKVEDGKWKYEVHYSGWNKKYDEWVDEVAVKKRTQGATGTAVEDADAAAALLATKVDSGGAGDPAAPGQGKRRGSKQGEAQGASEAKRARQGDAAAAASGDLAAAGGGAGAPTAAAPSTSSGSQQVDFVTAFEIPPALQKQLLDDHDAINEDGTLLPLPRRPCVADIVQQYMHYARERKAGRSGPAAAAAAAAATASGGGVSTSAEDDLMVGLRMYFDKALKHCLLYQQERRQADRALGDGRVASSIYGAEHFLRLFVKLPELFPQTPISEEQLVGMVARLQDVLRFLQLRHKDLFLASDKYLPAALGEFMGA